MDSSSKSPPRDKADAKTAFRKPTNDATNRKYRRRSPTSGSSSSGGSPIHEHNSSPIFSKEDSEKVSDRRQRRKGDGRELDRDAGRSQYRKTADSYRHSDRQSSRSSRGHYRYDDHVRQEKHAADEGDRDHHNLSSRSGRESRVGNYSDHVRQESEHSRARDYFRGTDKYSRDKHDNAGYRSKDKEKETSSLEHQKYKDKDLSSDRAGSGRRHTNSNFEDSKAGEQDKHLRDGDGPDERKDYRRGLGDYKSDRSISHEESRGHRNDSTSGRDSGGYRSKEVHKNESKEVDGQKPPKDEKKKYDEWKTDRHKDRYNRESREQFEDKTVVASENQESAAKKPKLVSLEKSTDYGKDVSRFSTAVADMKQSSSSKLAQDIADKVTPEHAFLNNSEVANDLNAAKIAAMKAAELVNRNLVGVGYMSADQKKKLLWGSKKSTTAEESGHHWDTALFSDRERQEKFNKLMSLRLPWYIWPIVGCERRGESGAQTRQPRCREAEGIADGFREAIHCWSSTKRWPHRWTRSLRTYPQSLCTLTTMFVDILLYYSWASIMCLVILYSWHDRENMRCLFEVSELDKECDIVGLLCLMNLKLGLPRDQSRKGTCDFLLRKYN
ncbi:arginine/serine-rich coiled-coil protein 2 isoform X1 [Vitis riparia]|uniref:arginine/serine-rich coiled-coil protein 2 isoform X1 n=1 Tax=Vitis riparia TaxID=96939 RepID=UPI00155B1505|nr:arginine/serine-rich coiled-coil protein 2 isoform X1 [Vitis riparia]XP_034694039.1 arginine/serine-rich coiled-coil protein 2 isoform X1 [Vitis riparia]XP_034694040.1 arginine/serine-rich coiled-coil protein 2 isoform X1 [Vitis riparia]